MGASDRRIAALLRQVATQDILVLRQEMSLAKRLAAQAYVAEQCGFEYGEARREGPRQQILVVHIPRHPSRGPGA